MAGVLNSLFDQVGGFRFLKQALDDLITQGRVRQVPVMRAHWWVEEWFLDVETGEIYSYVPLAERIMPEWQKVDLSEVSGDVKRESLGEYLDKQAGPSPEGLRALPTGRFTYAEAEIFRALLPGLISAGLAKRIEPPEPPLAADDEDEWFADTGSGEIYRLTNDKWKGEVRWNRVRPVHKSVQ